jgi:hypothetical protein
MDVEKTIQFLLEQQAKFEASLATAKANFDAGMEELRKSQQATERLINAFARAGQAQIELHQSRLDNPDRHLETQEQEFRAFLDRFDAYLRGRGNGHGA